MVILVVWIKTKHLTSVNAAENVTVKEGKKCLSWSWEAPSRSPKCDRWARWDLCRCLPQNILQLQAERSCLDDERCWGGDQRDLSHPRFLAALGNLGITTCWYLEKHQITLNAMNQFWVSRQQKYLCVCPNCLFYCLVSPFKAKKKISDNLKYMSARKPLVIFIVNTAAVKTACLYYEEGEWNIRSHQHLSSCSFLLLFCLKGEKTLF